MKNFLVTLEIMSEYVLLGVPDIKIDCKHASWSTNKIGGKAVSIMVILCLCLFNNNIVMPINFNLKIITILFYTMY